MYGHAGISPHKLGPKHNQETLHCDWQQIKSWKHETQSNQHLPVSVFIKRSLAKTLLGWHAFLTASWVSICLLPTMPLLLDTHTNFPNVSVTVQFRVKKQKSGCNISLQVGEIKAPNQFSSNWMKSIGISLFLSSSFIHIFIVSPDAWSAVFQPHTSNRNTERKE